VSFAFYDFLAVIESATFNSLSNPAITTKPNTIRELSGDCKLELSSKATDLTAVNVHPTVSTVVLSEWIRNLTQLQALSVWSGNALGQYVENDIRTHCPEFYKLVVFRW
jgi:hypothetical protein